MLDLPADDAGLSWIVSQGPTQLMLIPNVQPASVIAAAGGDQQALAFLRFSAQQNAAYPRSCVLPRLDEVCLEASKFKVRDEHVAFFDNLTQEDCQLACVFEARHAHTNSIFRKAASTGNTAALKWLQVICFQTVILDTPASLIHIAAGAGHLEALKFLCSIPSYEPWSKAAVVREAMAHLNCIQWLLSEEAPGGPCPSSDWTNGKIARIHGLPALQWLDASGKLPRELRYHGLLHVAVRRQDQPMLEWLRALEFPPPWDSMLCTTAAANGAVTMLAGLRSQDPPCPWEEKATAAAVEGGDFDTLKWLRAQDPPCPWGPSVCAAAARSGRLDTLQWLRSQSPPCPWDASCSDNAASQPTLEVLQWLRAEGCPLSALSTVRAAERGDLSMLQWLRSISCPLHPSCVSCAVKHGNVAMLEWLWEQGCPLTKDLWSLAAVNPTSRVLRFLYDKNVPKLNSSAFNCLLNRPYLMFIADIGIQLPSQARERVRQARKAYCTFHGLIRWCRHAVSETSSRSHQAFESSAGDRSGQMLLTQLCLLPQELIKKISIAAELNHDIFSPADQAINKASPVLPSQHKSSIPIHQLCNGGHASSS